jgi:hypothetical protein
MGKKFPGNKARRRNRLTNSITVAFGIVAALSLSVSASIDSKPLQSSYTPMTQQQLETEIRALSQHFMGGGSNMQFDLNGIRMACISDINHDRMRIISPIVSDGDITLNEYKAITEANFHLTLDARYASSNGVLYAAYIHPLSTLHPEELHSALRQVAALAKNFGTSYSSDELIYGGQP